MKNDTCCYMIRKVICRHKVQPPKKSNPDEDILKMIIVSPGSSDALEELKTYVIQSNESTKFSINDMNSITGFHIQTRNHNIFSIEAGRRQIETIWRLEMVLKLREFSYIFYDTSFVANKRLYGNLDMRFSRIILNFGLDEALQNALLYCQSAISKDVTSTFIKLKEYTKRTDMKAMAG